ncbi:MAG: sulfatase family protein [Planctomycetota bacterium]
MPGWSDIGCYGGEIRTPHIDELAVGGLRFTQFYNNAICGPTRASLLTGLYCQQAGHSGRQWNQPKDFDRCVTIAELLQAAGYRTMMVGKCQGHDLAVERGFDRFFGPMCQGMVSYFHEVQLNPFYLDRARWTFPEEGFFMTEAFIDHAVGFVEEAARGKRPFFLDVAGWEYPTGFHGRKPLPLEGKSLAPILRGESREGHVVLCWNLPQTRAIRMGRWKLVEPGRKQPWELYDLETDGTETRNLAGEYPERVQDMVARWQAWAERCGARQ